MADFVAKITKPGIDVRTATAPKDFLLYSEQHDVVMRIRKTTAGSGTVAIIDTGLLLTTVTVTHGLGYKPFYQVFIKWNHALGNTDWINATNGDDDRIVASIHVTTWATDTTVVIYFENAAPLSGMTVDYKVFVGEDPIS
jgi:hypothetical protein